jgi:poly(A) polymerase
MLRAIRFAAKLGFSIEAATAAPIKEQAELLESINNARLFDESLKLFLSGNAAETFNLLEQYDLLPYLLNDSEEILLTEFNRKMFTLALLNTDKRIQQGKTINPAFLWAVFLWPALNQLKSVLENESYPPMAALHEAANSVLSQQVKHVAITKRFQQVIKEIWELQLRLPNTQGKRALKAFEQPRFRAAYDFLLLREQAGEETGNLGEWWTHYQERQPKNTAPPHEVARKEEVRKTPRRRKPRTADKA